MSVGVNWHAIGATWAPNGHLGAAGADASARRASGRLNWAPIKVALIERVEKAKVSAQRALACAPSGALAGRPPACGVSGAFRLADF